MLPHQLALVREWEAAGAEMTDFSFSFGSASPPPSPCIPESQPNLQQLAVLPSHAPQHSHGSHILRTALVASAALWSSAIRSENWMGLRGSQSQPTASSLCSACSDCPV